MTTLVKLEDGREVWAKFLGELHTAKTDRGTVVREILRTSGGRLVTCERPWVELWATPVVVAI